MPNADDQKSAAGSRSTAYEAASLLELEGDLEPLSRPGLQYPHQNIIGKPAIAWIGLSIMSLGALQAAIAGAVHWPWYSLVLSVLMGLVGLALYKPLPFLLQAERGGLALFLLIVTANLLMLCALMFGVGRLGALTVAQILF